MICRLMLIVHQRNARQRKRSRSEDLRIGIVAYSQIDIAASRPARQRQSALDQITGFARELSASVPTNYFRSESGCFGKRNRFRKRSRCDDDFVIATGKLICERAEEWDMR